MPQSLPNRWMSDLADVLGLYSFELTGIVAVLLVSLVCGMVGAMVVGNRMAFFSDAMAHCAFAGVSLGMLLTILATTGQTTKEREPVQEWLVPLVMVLFSASVGVGIAYVRERTTLATDTVIGVFFAGAIGCGAVLIPLLRALGSPFNPEAFLFGNPWAASGVDVVYLLFLVAVTILLLLRRYNDLVFASFNPSLARSRRIALRVNDYLFIVLLALIVNFSLRAVGVLLINGLLIIPAATACNVSRNMRQMFWLTVVLSVGCGVIGLWLSAEISASVGGGRSVQFGPSGPILLLGVFGFFLSMAVPSLRRLARGVNR